MKAHIADNYSFTSEDAAVLDASLNLFISNDVDGVSSERKLMENTLARSVLKKLQMKETRFSGEEMRSIYVSLLFFRSFISEAGIDPDKSDPALKMDSEKYLSAINRLLSVLKRQLLASGVDIDSI